MRKRIVSGVILLVLLYPFMSSLPKASDIDAYSKEVPHDVDSNSTTNLPFGGFVDYGGISDSDLYFSYSDSTYTISFKKSEIAFQMMSANESSRFSLTFPGSNFVIPQGRERNVRIVNYFIGDWWETDIPTWNEIWYFDIYHKIDLRYYYSESGIKYEFLVHPGADLSLIRVQATETTLLSVSDTEVLVTFPGSHLRFQDNLGRIYEKNGGLINGRFQNDAKRQHCYGFSIDEYDTSDILVIDPMLVFSTYLGGSDDDSGSSIAVDQVGCSYITGTTASDDFPTVNALNSSSNSGTDVFVAKLNERGDAILFSTYLGGAGTDIPHGIKIDSSGYVIITGRTQSDDFPLMNAYQDTRGGDWDVFIIKLEGSGNAVSFSSYFGGSARDYGYDLDVGLDDSIFITGETRSSNFPTKDAMSTSLNGTVDVIAVKFSPSGSLIFSTYVGGSGDEIGAGICVGTDSTCYITGFAGSGFPMKNPYDADFGGDNDIFVCRLNSTGNGLVFSTYVGGNTFDAACDIGLDASNNVYIVGYSYSDDYPLLNEYQSSLNGASDIIISVLNSTGNGLEFSTYYGSSSDDSAQGGLDIKNDLVYVTGYTCSSDFPLYLPYDDTYGGDYSDAFILSINTTDYQLEFSSFWSGTGVSSGEDIAVDAWGDYYLCGKTISIPVKNAIDDTYNGMGDAFVSKFSNDEISPTLDTPLDKLAEKGDPGEQIIWSPTDANPLFYRIFVNGSLEVDNTWDGSPIVFPLNLLDLGVRNVTIAVCDRALNSATDTVLVTMDDTIPPTINDIDNISYEEGSTGNNLTWTPGDWNPSIYRIFQDSSLIKQGMWNSSSENISLSIDGLSIGTFNFTIIVFDEGSNAAIDYVNVTVTEFTLPTINDILDLSYEEGTTGHNLTWTPSDLYPSYYEIYHNDELYRFADWNSSSESIYIDIDGLPFGVHNYTIIVYDQNLNFADDTVLVTVLDSVAPIIIELADFQIDEGEPGSNVTWLVSDTNPDSYEILQDGVQVASGNWTDSIFIPLHGLALGEYNFTLVIFDKASNSATDTVLVTIVDGLVPTVTPLEDIDIEFGYTSFSLSWTCFDLHPSNYSLTRNNEIVESGVWNGGNVSLTIIGLDLGEYTYVLTVNDTSGNMSNDTVAISIIDTIAPEINHPQDITYKEGENGNNIAWIPADLKPGIFEVYRDGTRILTGTWNESAIVINVDDLLFGAYNYTIIAYDSSGNSASDTVYVQVTQLNAVPDFLSYIPILGIIALLAAISYFMYLRLMRGRER
ncbi:MAG: SBBP repeat-containing protein [Promethearchaeota archaeon]